jgi:hypothetical protein
MLGAVPEKILSPAGHAPRFVRGRFAMLCDTKTTMCVRRPQLHRDDRPDDQAEISAVTARTCQLVLGVAEDVAVTRPDACPFTLSTARSPGAMLVSPVAAGPADLSWR